MNAEIKRLNHLLTEVHDQTVPLAKLLRLPKTSVENLPVFIKSVTKYLESNIVYYDSKRRNQKPGQTVDEKIHQDERGARSPEDNEEDIGHDNEETVEEQDDADRECQDSNKANDNNDEDSETPTPSSKHKDLFRKAASSYTPRIRGGCHAVGRSGSHTPHHASKRVRIVTPSRRPVYHPKQVMLSP